jgi:cell division protein FtsQ
VTARARRWLRRGVLLLVLGLVVFAVWAVGWSSLLGVRHVDVSGERRTSQQVVLAAGAVPADQPLLRVDLGAIASRVEKLPTVAHVQVSRVWPRTVRISITERVPIAVVHRGPDMRLIDANGVDFAAAPAGAPYPRLDLNLAAAPPADVRAGLAVVQALPGAMLRRVGSVQAYNPTDVRLILTDGAIVIWGSADRSLDKAEVFTALERTHPKATTFDVSAPDAPAIRK